MNEIQKKLTEVEMKISYLDFKDHWEMSDYDLMDKYHKEAEELANQLKGISGWYLRKDNSYFTGDKTLVWSSTPTLFDSTEEITTLLMASDLAEDFKANPEEFIYVRVNGKGE